ncbi:hypothetical protein FACS189421_13770 [Bacteroidia bacterium]|nr:hypothetical protein FACS189421_13770 [Bacteroidia bacterium]GHT05581.1 hypothetical protein FACS189423_09890 [Bacteroidia bacterium]GHT45474.1 hypothetical protein FACS189440_01550 [Bacteroidia bacterium]
MAIHQQFPQGMDGKKHPINKLLEEASDVVRRCKEAANTIKPTEDHKGNQIAVLKEFATNNNLWLDFTDSPIIYLDKGGENEVFYDGKSSVIKFNNFEYAGEDLTNFFIRMVAHNYFFNNIPYELIGFAENSRKEFCAVLKQPYVQAKREAKVKEITQYMKSLGFAKGYYSDEFYNDKYEIFDAVPNNVLYGKDDILYFIDTQIRLREIEITQPDVQ